MSGVLDAELTAITRAESGRVIATLTRRFGDLDIAEDAFAEALVVAVQKWPIDGIPPNPGGWLTTVASNKALDRLRREKRRLEKYAEATMLTDDTPTEPTGPIEDDRLRLIFTCCHPALALENRVAMTLRLLGGLTVAEIAAAFLVPETTMAQRITRAKAKIRDSHIPYRVPALDDIDQRLSGVLAVVYLVFNEGYLSTQGTARLDLCDEAIRLTRQLRTMIAATPGVGPRPEVDGLLALMLLTQARHHARFAADGILIAMPDQDRALWDTALIDEGHQLVRGCLASNRPGPYQIQAAINAVHTDALDASMTDWGQIARLYDQLLAITPSAVVRLNRAVALAELDGPEVALAEVDRLELRDYHPWWAVRADLLRRLERTDEARAAYDRAIALTENTAERTWLAARRDGLRADRA
ncbi:MAG TPA: RNA polymerase sigma factor [Marmoricola sp.]